VQKTYLFYDLETTGRSKCFDQILQFAAIRTDLALNTLERHTIQIKLNPDVVPDPEAILVHRIPMAETLEGESEIDAISQIYALLNTPGTCSGGYNTLRFDDEFLRFLFHRNLLPPYRHQWAEGCGRFDLYPLAQLYYLYNPECLHWPTNGEGKVSLKLADISAANQLATGPAHQAIVDVEATVALARIFMQNEKMWTYGMETFSKEAAQKHHQKITSALETPQGSYQIALLIGKAGSADAFQYPVLALGQHQHYKNQTLWLRLDKPELVSSTEETFTETTWVAHQKAGETLLLPYTDRFKRHLSPERLALVEENLSWIRNHLPLLQKMQHYYQHYTYPDIPGLDVDADLYVKGFLTRPEEQLCVQFHTVPAQKKADIAESFRNPRLREIATRVMGRHYPQYVTSDLAEGFERYMQQINPASEEDAPTDWRGEKRRTPRSALQRLKELREEKKEDVEGLLLLDTLEAYIKKQFF
jgi:exodeoxyribonuclease-1